MYVPSLGNLIHKNHLIQGIKDIQEVGLIHSSDETSNCRVSEGITYIRLSQKNYFNWTRYNKLIKKHPILLPKIYVNIW